MNLSESTVVELRKLAKEKGIKLGAGVSKAQIVEKIEAALATQEAAAQATAAPTPTEPEKPAQEEKLAEPQFRQAWRSPSTPQYSTKPAYQAPVYPTKPAWQAKSVQPRTPMLRQEPPRTPAPRPTNYTPRFGPAAQDDPQPAPRNESPFARETEYRPAAPRPDFNRPSPYRSQEPAPYRSEPYRSESYRQDTYRQDGYRQDSYRQDGGYAPRPRRETGYYNAELGTSNPAVPELLAAGECGDGQGLLEIHPDGYGFLRSETFLPGCKDIYVSMAQIRRFGLRTGDYVIGKTRPQRESDKYAALLYITQINGQSPDEMQERPAFDRLTPVYPTCRILLGSEAEPEDTALRLVDLIAPIGFGQRGLIVTPPHAGKTTLLKALANAIAKHNPQAQVMILLLDERPEEVTEFKDSVAGCEVVASTFDQSPESHVRMAEMLLERAQRLCEGQKDVVIIADSLSRLAKAYAALPSAGSRNVPGSLNPAVVYKAKRLFGAARALREGGSLTVLATLSQEANSRWDDALAEEFRGTANMELYLDKELADKGVYPAISLQKSGTRREDLLLSDEGKEGLKSIRAMLASASAKDALVQLMDLMSKTTTNQELLGKMQDWIALWEKSGFVLQR
ncbi:MAG: transcription termination factor Rho [Clostridia bacterium]|nr:transcription termination factor Rho [Clostridia bacterium]